MRLAFISTSPVKDGSKSLQRDQVIFNSLKAYGHDLTPIYPPPPSLPRWQILLNKVLQRGWRTLGFNYRIERSPWVLKAHAKAIEAQLRDQDIDLIFSLSTLYTAYLKISVPMITWVDAVFESIIDFYESHSNMDPISIWQGHRAEQRSLQRCALSIYSSSWAAKVAALRYQFPIERLRIVNRGPNIIDIPYAREISEKQYKSGRLRCLLLGNDWIRKGGDIAVAALSVLRSMGLDISLTIIGMTPPSLAERISGLRCLPLLHKDDPEEWALMKQAFQQADVYLLPSRADFTPNVICEAYAFGLPVIGSSVGAIPEMIEHGETGFLTQEVANSQEYAMLLMQLANEPETLYRMAIQSRQKYEAEFTLDGMARKLSAHFQSLRQQHITFPRRYI